jgi:hypothetical protein
MKKNPPVAQVLEQVVRSIQKGCRKIDRRRRLAKGCDDLFRRRYQLSFEARLAEEGSWARDKAQVLRAAELHGVIAAAAAQFSPKGTIPQTVFMKAAYMVEIECEQYVRLAQARRLKKNEPFFGGQWCW